MDKYREDRELLVKAFEEAICNRFDKVIAESTATGECSEQHKARMKAIIDEANAAQAKRINRTKLIAALVAAALLLTGCTLYVLRNKIKCFIENIYETHVCVEKDNEPRKGYITEVYSLSYVPHGYELIDESINEVHVFYRWEKLEGEWLQFIQELMEEKFFADINQGYSEILEYADITIYYRKSEEAYNYCWYNETSGFYLISTEEIGNDELIKILNGIIIK